jgi:hypothetical protein
MPPDMQSFRGASSYVDAFVIKARVSIHASGELHLFQPAEGPDVCFVPKHHLYQTHLNPQIRGKYQLPNGSPIAVSGEAIHPGAPPRPLAALSNRVSSKCM